MQLLKLDTEGACSWDKAEGCCPAGLNFACNWMTFGQSCVDVAPCPGACPMGLHVKHDRNVSAPFHMFTYPCAASNLTGSPCFQNSSDPHDQSFGRHWEKASYSFRILQYLFCLKKGFLQACTNGLALLAAGICEKYRAILIRIVLHIFAAKEQSAQKLRRQCNQPMMQWSRDWDHGAAVKRKSSFPSPEHGLSWLPSCLDRWDLLSHLLYQQVPWLILHFQTWKLALDATRTPVSLGFHCGLDLHFVRIDFLGFWARSLID